MSNYSTEDLKSDLIILSEKIVSDFKTKYIRVLLIGFIATVSFVFGMDMLYYYIADVTPRYIYSALMSIFYGIVVVLPVLFCTTIAYIFSRINKK